MTACGTTDPLGSMMRPVSVATWANEADANSVKAAAIRFILKLLVSGIIVKTRIACNFLAFANGCV